MFAFIWEDASEIGRWNKSEAKLALKQLSCERNLIVFYNFMLITTGYLISEYDDELVDLSNSDF